MDAQETSLRSSFESISTGLFQLPPLMMIASPESMAAQKPGAGHEMPSRLELELLPAGFTTFQELPDAEASMLPWLSTA